MGGVRVVANQIPIGKVVAVINYLMQMLGHLIMMSHLIMQFSRAQASFSRIQEILASEPEIDEPAEGCLRTEAMPYEGTISFADVTFSYDGLDSEPVLQNVSFDVARGEKIAVLGETGSGKTSLIHLIPRLYDIDSGGVKINVVDVREWPSEMLRRRIGMAPQQVVLFSGTIESNIDKPNSPSPDQT